MKSRKCVVLSTLGVFFISIVLFGSAANSADPSEYPSRPIEWLTHSGPSGSLNVIGQLFAEISKGENILKQPFYVTQKPGSGMAKAFGYLYEKKGEDHLLACITQSLVIGTPLTVKVPYNYKDFTPIANLVIDGSTLVVGAKSPYKTFDDLIEAAKKKPNQLTQGLSSVTSTEGLMGRMIQKLKGVRWKFVSFEEENQATLNVLGGLLDFALINPTAAIDHVRAGNMRVLLACSKKRYKEFPDAPTMKELGMELNIAHRGIIGPPEMPDYARKTLEGAAKKIIETAKFQKYLDQMMMQVEWMDSSQYAKFLEKQHAFIEEMYIEAGVIKK